MTEDNEFLTSSSDGIVISACPVLVEENRRSNDFCFGYYLCIENNSDRKIQLVGKNWNITDELGNRYSDTSAGFKGELPELEPGEYFEFTSEAPLKSANAVFYGSCQVVSEGQNKVREVKIPTFNLSAGNASVSRILN